MEWKLWEKEGLLLLLISTAFTASDFHKTFPHRAAASVAAAQAVRSTASYKGIQITVFLSRQKSCTLKIDIWVFWENKNVMCVLFPFLPLLLSQRFPCSEEGGGHSSYRRGGAEVTRDDWRSRERRNGHKKWICCPERLQHAEVMLSPGTHVIQGHHGKQPPAGRIWHLQASNSQGNFPCLWSSAVQDWIKHLCSRGWKGGLADILLSFQDLRNKIAPYF